MTVTCRPTTHQFRDTARRRFARSFPGIGVCRGTKGDSMRAIATAALVVFGFVSLPSPSFAQALGSVAGVVKDASGAVLPGVTVEAASPALIEKIRTVVTDGSGQYQIVSLPPGVYAVTFTLGGFSTVKREGIQVTINFTATVNADLKVGAVSETITVT